MNKLDFVSNKRTIEQLGVMLDSRHFPHALIIEGDDGLGKKTLARLLAAALVCRGESKPCMECAQCHKAMKDIHPDISEFTATGGKDSFKVDTVREVIKDSYMSPNEAEYKVYILGNAHKMSASAQNALLKILEEPPEYVVFILTAQSKSLMLETVLSRSVVVSLEGVDAREGAEYICSHNDGIDFDEAFGVLETFGGNIGKALEALSQGRAQELNELCVNICEALLEDNEYHLLTLCKAFQNDRQLIVLASDFLKNIFRDALVFTDESESLSGQRELAKKLKSRLTRKRLINLVDFCDELKRMAQGNCNNTLLITKICYGMKQATER
ncbi:MAG: hypothetical protein IJ851_07105 [Eubacterium sp.]|nr:hypothetical protein [Eubacterium sp.]